MIIKWFKNLKIRNKLLLAFGTLISMLVILSISACVQTLNIENNYSQLLNAAIKRQDSLAGAIKDLRKIRSINSIKGYSAVSSNINITLIDDLNKSYKTYVDSYTAHLDDYCNNVNNSRNFTEIEKQERITIINGINELFADNYTLMVSELNSTINNNTNTQSLFKLMPEIIVLGDHIADEVHILYSMTFTTIIEKAEEAAYKSREAIIIILSITAGLFIVSIFLSIFTAKSIKKPIEKIECAMSEISKGNLNYPIRSDQEDELGILSNRIGDMVDNISEMNKTMTVMDYLDTMIGVVDLDYNIIYMNRRVSDVFEIDSKSYNKKCYEALRNYNKPCSFCLLSKFLPEKDSLPCGYYEDIYDEKLDAWLSGRGAMIRWIDGSIVYLHCFTDATMKMKYKEQLREALKDAEAASAAKSAFLANMSHDLRTPLNVVVGLTELKLEENLPEDYKETLQKVKTAGETLLSMVNDILDISKVESGKLTLTPVEYDTPCLIHEIITPVITRIGEKPITFRLNISDDMPKKLFGDDMRVKQILNNLLDNAVKYTERGTVDLELNFIRDGGNIWMEITVRDTGIGIQKDKINKLFDTYYRVEENANRKINGTGLGLPITKRLAELMDGAISAESEYGWGSMFRVRLRQGFVNCEPLGSVAADSLRSFRFCGNNCQISRKLVRADLCYARVLIVDDMPSNLEVAAGLLRKYKMQADCETGGRAAIERIKRGKPVYDAVFIDHMMPEIDGIETTEAIRALGTEYARTIPIIALTANAISGTKEMFLEHGFQAFLSKPIDIMSLDTIVRQWIERKSYETEMFETAKVSAVKSLPCPKSCNAETAMPVFEITGIDAQIGLAHCDGDYKIYQSVLRAYAAHAHEIIGKLRDVTEETLPYYVIAVHGLKSSSANIGAEKIKEAAANLETMAKNGDLPEILSRNKTFLEDIESLVSGIQSWIKEYDSKRVKSQLYEPDRTLLDCLRKNCEQYDMDGVEKIMTELESANYEKDADLIIWLRQKIDTFDFPHVMEQLAEYAV
ncbi:MAG: ATP-binding protein [Oscillospiraceae bacterium]|nr:ATP-binding protein [Oscillospiraceae bacterium]